MNHAGSGAWARLWRAGVPHSCSTAVSGNYRGEMRRFWARQAGLLHDGARVVDIGTGNGAVALLIRDEAIARGLGVELHGVDAAEIDPPAVLEDGVNRLAGIRFHPGVRFDAMPFSDSSIDLVCSQYAFEYGERASSVREIMRVLRHGGIGAFVIHSTDSLVARTALDQIQGTDHLLADDGIIPHARAMVRVIGVNSCRPAPSYPPDPRAEAARLAFNESSRRLLDLVEQLPAADILRRTVLQLRDALLLAKRAPEDAETKLVQLHASILDERERLGQLQRSLVSAQGLEQLATEFQRAGASTTTGELREGAEKMGWTLELRRD